MCAACYLLILALFYNLQHAFKDGTLKEIKLRHLGAADGSTVIVKNVRYASSFLNYFCICIRLACKPAVRSILIKSSVKIYKHGVNVQVHIL